ncbi:sensor domain-containing diguanylate cyclase [Acerihabitans sp. TG2]|uniref:sensor domain-containing diguanylate cyclase n=1 Tax=Acerihabitans sp. TG2 TaxID=3096008 RepID=UPI002B236ED2|nr:sensor domain-containing diguanylate cyclase [Acerihabitans sp. TG2]MEA9391941.1 sensor domain-containing diguanylate cyclase [Acerihabitans sp. TG2]
MRNSSLIGLNRQNARDATALKRRRFSLTVKLVASSTLLIVIMLVLNGWHIWKTYHQALARSQVSTLNLTQALSQHANDTFMQASTTLADLAGYINRFGMGPEQLLGLHQSLQEKTRSLPQINAISLYDAQGNILAAATDRLPKNKSFADSAFFLYHRDHPQLTAHIGSVIKSRLTGKRVLPISRRLNDPDGRFAGVVMESVTLDHFRHFYTKFIISDNSTFMLLLSNGTLLYRHPYDEKIIGTSIADTALFKQEISRNVSGLVTRATDNDQEWNVYSYQHLKDFPVIIISATSLDRSLVDWRKDAISHLIMTMIFVVTIVLISLLLMRQMRARMQAEIELIHAQQELCKLNRSLERLADSDGLTNLYNRRHFDLTLANELTHALQHQQTLGIILLDIDYFKQFNEIYGHVAGDDCLKLVGKTLNELPLRQRDLVARYGSEEFIVLLSETDEASTRAIAARIYQEIQGLQILHQGSPTGFLTLSLGAFVGQPVASQDTPSTLIAKADAALYQAKRQGRDQICGP